jgi:hypothetical protein
MNKSVKLFVNAAIAMAVLHPVPLYSAKKVYHTRRINSNAPVIDGQLDDPAWQTASWGCNFFQKQPYEGAPPSQDTAFKILYDEENLYVGIRAFDTEPGKIVKRMTRRDNRDGDWVEIILDSYFDHRTGFAFSVNAAGVKTDTLISEDGSNWDDSYDPIWYVKTTLDTKGWVAEMRIPLTQLRFGKKENHTWGLHMARFLHRKQETCEWQLIPRKAHGWVSLFGELQGLNGIKPKRPIELLPYSLGKLQHFEQEEGNPFVTGKSSSAALGLDGKIGITNDLTLDFSVNPDFGQVEADPSEVNLTAFETFFPEKRPFFIEGRNILDYQVSGGDGPYAWDNVFYSRRIGRTPQHEPDTGDNEYVRSPENTTILAAFKLTGKTRKGLSIGIMESVTAREYAETDMNGKRGTLIVEPLTNYFVLRLHKDYNQGNTGIGGIFTTTHRSLENAPHLNYLHREAYTGGLDFFHYWKSKEWELSIKTVFSHVKGDTEALLETQQSSLRYYQRPDADYLTLDPGRTTLSGHGGDINFGKTGGGHLRLMTGLTWRSPGLELNDVGYLRAADRILQWVWAAYVVTDPFFIFRSFDFNINQYTQWSFGAEKTFGGFNCSTNMEFKNYWSLRLGIERLANFLSIDALRGGPALKMPGGWYQWGSIATDPRKRLHLRIGFVNYWEDFDSSRWFQLTMGGTYKLANALSFSLESTFSDLRNDLQYVDTVEKDSLERYVFAHIRQKTLGITLRLNYSITPNLSIQFYGQPFISNGKYTAFKFITQPRAAVYDNRFHLYAPGEIYYDDSELYYYIDEQGGAGYSFEDPNFKFLQFRSNLVVRWEYTPGSTLYLVWSQGRTDTFTDNIGFSPSGGIRDLSRIHPHDVFLVKFTYRFKI